MTLNQARARARFWLGRIRGLRFAELVYYRKRLVERSRARLRRELAARRVPLLRLQLRFKLRRNWEGADLRRVDLRGISLARCSFRGANLSDAMIEGAGLRENFSGAILHRATIYRCDLSRLGAQSDLAGAILREVRCSDPGRPIAARLRGANLQGAVLRGINLSGADLRGTDLRYADLREANLEFADLGGRANLQGANLAGARLFATNLARADLTGANLRGADLRNANLANADLQMAEVADARLNGACLDQTFPHADGH